ncbi:MAG: GNAT family N-acetyltransferase [Candidatus Magasanikbacteria bacterium]
MSYLTWSEQTISNFSNENINRLYNDGYVFTRIGKGVMHQTRSLRINLEKFSIYTKNTRVLNSTKDVLLESHPIPYSDYHWSIHKLGKDFYTNKFNDVEFSAQKIKELITDKEKSNYNALFVYKKNDEAVGYTICKETDELIHYAYPFYRLDIDIRNLGMGMMLKAIIYAKEQGKKYVYLGSAQRPTDTYKLQIRGLEWFDGKEWKVETDELKHVLQSTHGDESITA